MSSFPLDDHTHPWFIDRDDGTIIHFFLSDETIKFVQNDTLNECDVFTAAEELEFVETLPSDFSFASGSVSRFEDRLSLMLEEYTPSRVGEPTILAKQNESLPAETFITRYDFINIETLGVSDGGQAQTFSTSGDDIKTPTKGTATIQAGSETFTVTPDISTAGPDDTVFEYDEVEGDVLFGNGSRGKIPADGAEIILKLTIRNGGGQWEFAGIIVEPKDCINIGNVKSVQDKILYSQAEINMASQSGFASVTYKVKSGTLNFYDSKIADQPPARILLGRNVFVQPTWGEEILGEGGTITLYKTSGAGYVNPQPKAADDITFVIPPFNTLPFKALEIDTSVVYPGIRATMEDMTPSDVQIELSRMIAFQLIPIQQRTVLPQSEDIHSGVITSPKQYDDTVILVNPLASVAYGFPSIGTNPPVTDDGPDLSTIDYLEWSVTGTAVPIIAPGFDLRLIRMGTKTGDFDNPLDTTTNEQFSSWKNSFTGEIQTTGLPGGNFDSGLTWVKAGAYATNVPFAVGDLAEHLIMRYEGRLTDERKAYLTQIGSPTPPDFICEWTFELTNVSSFDRPEDSL